MFVSLSKHLLAAKPVPESFSHNTKRSHPELSALYSLSSQANKSSGMLSESEGRSLPSRLRCLLTLTLPLSVSHNKGSWRTQHKAWIGHSQSVTDHLRMYYNLVTQTRSEAAGLKFVWVCVQIGQLSCKACVCVSGTLSVMKKAPFKMLSGGARRLLLSGGVHCFFGGLILFGRWLWTFVYTFIWLVYAFWWCPLWKDNLLVFVSHPDKLISLFSRSD